MANDIARARPLYDQDRSSFRELLTASAASRNLPGAMMIDKDAQYPGDCGHRHQAGLHAAAAGLPQQRQRDRARDRGIARRELCRGGDPAPRLRRYLPLCRAAARSARGRRSSSKPRPASPNMPQIEARRLGIQVGFALMFAVIALTILMASVLIGLEFRQLAGGADPAADGRGQRSFRPAISMSRFPCTNRKAISPSSARPSTR